MKRVKHTVKGDSIGYLFRTDAFKNGKTIFENKLQSGQNDECGDTDAIIVCIISQKEKAN